jgi:hypothetical protein
LFALCGCGEGIKARYVTTLKNWFFQENSGVNEYNFFFSLHGDDGDAIDAEVTADVRIEDESGNVLYKKTHTVTEKDYGDYTRQNTELHLACVRVPKSAVLPGVSSSGKAYLKVYREEIVEFDEVSCDVYYGLPVKDVKIVCETLPVELKMKDYRGNVESVIRVEEVKYAFNSDIVNDLKIELTGTKTQGGSNSFDHFIYKLYDSKGFMIDSGSVLLSSLSAGDRFKEDITIYKDVTPGETYTIKFEEYSY